MSFASNNFSSPVTRKHAEVSSSGQTSIILPFTVRQSNVKNLVLTIDGSILSEGIGNDYRFVNFVDNKSSEILLDSPLVAGLQVEALYLGVAIGDSSGGSGVGGINYIQTFDAEAGTTGWNVYKDAAQEVVEDGTGGAPSITFADDAAVALRGTKSFRITKPASNVQGEGVAYDFAIDEADKYSILRISADIKVSADYADGDLRIYLIDKTSGEVIRLSKEDIEASALNTKLVTEFQSTGSLEYRIVLHFSTTSALAATVDMDNVIVGPREITRGAVITDWKELKSDPLTDLAGTPPTLGTATTKYVWKREGNEAVVRLYIEQTTAGTAGSGAYAFDLSEIGKVDTSIIEPGSSSNQALFVGGGSMRVGGFYNAICSYDDGLEKFLVILDLRGGAASGTWGSAFAQLSNPSVTLSLEIRVPIVGWASNMAVSEDFGGRSIAFRAWMNSSSTGLPSRVIPFNSTDTDTTGSFNTSTSSFVVPESGQYFFSAAAALAAMDGSTAADIRIRKNGTTIANNYLSRFTNGSTASGAGDVNLVIDCAKGDEIDAYIAGDAAFSIEGGTARRTSFSGFKIQSPQTLSGGEVVSFIGESNAGLTVPHNSNTVFVAEDVEVDTHGAYNTSTGVFTVPLSGKYSITSMATLSSNTGFKADESLRLRVYVNNIAVRYLDYVSNPGDATTALSVCAQGSADFNLVKGDTVDIRIFQDANNGNINLLPNADFNWTTISKIN